MNEIKIQVPEGFDGIDEEKSDLKNGIIIFKEKKQVPWRYSNPRISGYFVDDISQIRTCSNNAYPYGNQNQNIFATEKQAKSMLAMAQLSQIIANDERFGGPITDTEWQDDNVRKFVVRRYKNKVDTDWFHQYHHFLAFHTKEQRDLFLQENEDLIRQYFMLD